nr:uncharacterized protein LOC129383671 isoform X1 [Dermacentor andersoni]XP_054924313.1 uncharacterized protein LOC129383671 isoform X1 [Dermacentor andersoni]
MALRELSFGLSRGPKPLLLPPLMQASTQNGLHIRFAPHGSDAKDIKFKLPRGLTKKMTLLMLFGREPQANRPMKAELMTTNRAGLSIGVEVFHNGEAAVRYRGLNGVAQRTKRVDVDKDGGFYVIVIDVDDNTEIQVKVNGVDLLQSRMLYDTKGLDILSIFLIKWKMYELHLISESAPVYPDKFTHSHYPRLALGAFLELSGTVAVLGNQDKCQDFGATSQRSRHDKSGSESKQFAFFFSLNAGRRRWHDRRRLHESAFSNKLFVKRHVCGLILFPNQRELRRGNYVCKFRQLSVVVTDAFQTRTAARNVNVTDSSCVFESLSVAAWVCICKYKTIYSFNDIILIHLCIRRFCPRCANGVSAFDSQPF